MKASIWTTLLHLILIGWLGVTLYRWWPHYERYAAQAQYDSSKAKLLSRGDALLSKSDAGPDRFVALALDSNCPTCQRSAPLYRALSQRSIEEPDWDLVVLQDLRDADLPAWLAAQQIHPDRIVQVSFSEIGVWGTPSLFVSDERGLLAHIKVGGLNARTEAALWRILDHASGESLDDADLPERVSVDEADRSASRGIAQLVDTNPARWWRATWSSSQAKRIPLNTLPVVASVELSKSVPLLIDCRRHPIGNCLAVTTALRSQGFTRLSLVVTGQ